MCTVGRGRDVDPREIYKIPRKSRFFGVLSGVQFIYPFWPGKAYFRYRLEIKRYIEPTHQMDSVVSCFSRLVLG